MNTIAVYCASSNQIDQVYFDAAFRLGQLFAQHHFQTIYGDGGIGLMGALADGVLSENGDIIGIIPQFMVDEGWNNPRSTKTIIVPSMHQRKATIEKMADAMVALPGGIGTFEELLECLTWKQLGLHTKPVVILNINHYFSPLLACLDQMVEQHFMRPIHRQQMFSVVQSVEEVIPALQTAPKWSTTIRREAAL